jgi:hypothetical protein
MRRLLLAVPIVIVAAVPTAPAAAPKTFSCGAPAVTVLLWPHGHKAIRSVHFPAAKTPNIQLYRIDPRFAGGNFLVYADARGNVHTAPGYCGKVATIAPAAIAQPTTLTGKRAVTCNIGAVQAFQVTRQAHGIKMLGRVGSRSLWTASITRAGKAKITFDSSACTLGPNPPK